MNDERNQPESRAERPGAEGTVGETSPDGGATERPRAKGGRPGRGTRPTYPNRPCLNCGDPTTGEYCPTCGQRKVDVKVSVRALFMEILEDDFILDKRLPKTIGALLFKPGFLTVEHVNGRIVRYIHPFRLYLVSSILFFLLLSFFSLQFVRNAMRSDTDRATSQLETGPLDDSLATLRVQLADTARTEDEVAELRAREAELVEQRRQLRLDSLTQRVADLDAALRQVEETTGDSAIPAPVRAGVAASRGGILEQLEAASRERQALVEDTAALPATRTVELDRSDRPLREVFEWGESPPSVRLGLIPAADSALQQQVQRIGDMTPREATETLMGTFFNYVPTMMFFLLPVFAGVLKLLYIRRRRFYAEHFVFLLHVHSMVFLVATAMLLVRSYVPSLLEALVGGWIFLYIFLAMKRVYGQGWLKTFAKYWTLGWMYFWILTFSVPLAFLATLLLF